MHFEKVSERKEMRKEGEFLRTMLILHEDIYNSSIKLLENMIAFDQS